MNQATPQPPANRRKSTPREPLKCRPAEGFVRIRDFVPHVIPVSYPTIWNWVRAGTFPAPVSFGNRMTCWPVTAIRQWIADHEKDEHKTSVAVVKAREKRAEIRAERKTLKESA